MPLVRFAIGRETELVPFSVGVRGRFERWLVEQDASGRRFDDEQRRWLEMMVEHVAGSLGIEVEDLDLAPFVGEGGVGRAGTVFEGKVAGVMRGPTQALVG